MTAAAHDEGASPAPLMTKLAVMMRMLVDGEQALPAVAKLIALVVVSRTERG